MSVPGLDACSSASAEPGRLFDSPNLSACRFLRVLSWYIHVQSSQLRIQRQDEFYASESDDSVVLRRRGKKNATTVTMQAM